MVNKDYKYPTYMRDLVCINCGDTGHKETSHCKWCNGLHNLCVDKLRTILKEHSKDCVKCPTI